MHLIIYYLTGVARTAESAQTHGKIETWHPPLKNRILLENDFLPGGLETHIAAFVGQNNHH